METVYLYIHGKNYILPLIPGVFYTFITMSFILHAPIGFGLESRLGMDPKSYMLSCTVALVISVCYIWFAKNHAEKQKENILSDILN